MFLYSGVALILSIFVRQIFRELYPEIEFFPKLPATSTSEQGDEDADEIAEL